MKITVEIDLEAVGRAIADHALLHEREGRDAMELMVRGAAFAIALPGREVERAAFIAAVFAQAAGQRALEIVQGMANPVEIRDLLRGGGQNG
ncbi:hypothetical protein HLH33_12010 [Gluconacetobacter diazotrophicus]|uniref:Uncharacterized protein n=1 Tax=Gluconacetobacter diazotrophicus TaxID=33996 RepID=A0A7W4I689_GLUDI|nr:hypothetical protein [Gluconacetobacter diazotrophicus]MBB2157025.1 hypothetical protein [Gluconacetobacter diazotrophicus]